MMRRSGIFMLVFGLVLFGATLAGAADDSSAPCPMYEQHHGTDDQASGMGMGRHGKMMGMAGMHGKGSGPHREMHGKMKGEGKGKGMCPGCPKMGGMKGKGCMCPGCPKMGGMGCGMRGHGDMGGGMMGPMHRWFAGLMAARPQLGFTDEQLTKLDDAMTAHQKFAIQKKADIRMTKIDLEQVLRRKPLDLAKAQALIQKMATQKGELQSEGIQLYDTVWNMLSEQQRASVTSRLGSPFPGPWDGGGSMFGGETTDDDSGMNEDEDEDSEDSSSRSET